MSAFNLARVQLVVEPEPDPAEREAIEIALERILAGRSEPPAYASAWRRAGVAENLEPDGG